MTYDLSRFLTAQGSAWGGYETALLEIRAGKKQSHWIWYIFPQLRGLGRSEEACYYAIADLDEARAYLAHPILGARLVEISDALLALEEKNPAEVMGSQIDAVKLRSSMTLFASVPGADEVFSRVLDRFFGGMPDGWTLELLEEQARHGSGA